MALTTRSAAASRSAGGTSSSTSSWTWRISRLSMPASSSAASMRTSATLKMSAARPWMPAFMAWRSPAWRMRKLGDAARGSGAPAEQGLGVAPLAGLGHRAVHVGPHRRERLEVGGQDEGRLLGLDVEALAQAVGLHAVGQPVADHLGLGPLFDRHVARLDPEHP